MTKQTQNERKRYKLQETDPTHFESRKDIKWQKERKVVVNSEKK